MLGITQLINIRRNSHVGFHESVPHSYAPQYWDPLFTNSPDCTRVLSNPASPCTSLSESSIAPTPHRHHSHSYNTRNGTHSHQLNLPPYPWPPSTSASTAPSPTPTTAHPTQQQQNSDEAISESQLQLVLPSIPQMVSPTYTCTATQSQQPQQQQQQDDDDHHHQPPPIEAPVPSTPPSGPSSPAPALVSTPRQEQVGRRAPAPAPKRRRVTRTVQPLACYFCRGRKIACGPPTNTRSGGDRTCEYVFKRLQLFSLKTLFSFFCVFIYFILSFFPVLYCKKTHSVLPKKKRHFLFPIFLFFCCSHGAHTFLYHHCRLSPFVF